METALRQRPQSVERRRHLMGMARNHGLDAIGIEARRLRGDAGRGGPGVVEQHEGPPWFSTSTEGRHRARF
jgi:hypothetical protein